MTRSHPQKVSLPRYPIEAFIILYITVIATSLDYTSNRLTHYFDFLKFL